MQRIIKQDMQTLQDCRDEIARVGQLKRQPDWSGLVYQFHPEDYAVMTFFTALLSAQGVTYTEYKTARRNYIISIEP